MAELLVQQADFEALELPDAHNVITKLSHEGRLLSGLNPLLEEYELYVCQLDAIAPIQGYYVPTKIPKGGAAPEHIREQWLGVHLPIRCKGATEDFSTTGLAVINREALHALEQQRPEAKSWWYQYFEDKAQREFLMTFPASAKSSIYFGYFIFESSDGFLIPRRQFTGALATYVALQESTT